MRNSVTELIYDKDGSVMSKCETLTIAEGIRVEMYSEPTDIKPREIVLKIGSDTIEMNYTDSLADMFGRIEEVSAFELLTACQATLWQPKAKVA
ncbi:hypothetical protein KD050_18830 [Psychrobacillus sp. INOP01]|uniref:hypothetical protein n=1 Tax=Psychrobacillus sp. INOP01 TaxID=2829187 RepID=UPI001BADF671|nr:hypothetical protein [Psychrobacillus sp. INOP01]QUG41305.1 hypothetical protein KD050_18830 [Psychrobacillus sp. INOP01]